MISFWRIFLTVSVIIYQVIGGSIMSRGNLNVKNTGYGCSAGTLRVDERLHPRLEYLSDGGNEVFHKYVMT